MPYAPLRRTIMPLGRAFGGGRPTGWWTSGGVDPYSCVAAYQPKGAASQAASYTNLANPGTYDAALGVAPTWASATGWTGTGSAWLDTGIVEGDQSWTYIVRYNQSAAPGGLRMYLSARQSATSDITIQAITGIYQEFTNHSGQISFGAAASNVVCVAGSRAYLNGTLQSGTMTAGTSPSIPIYLLARNNNGTAAMFLGTSDTIVAVAIYNTTLGSTAISALTTAMNAL